MRPYVLVLAAIVAGNFLWSSNAAAFPGERMPYRAAHFAGRVVHNVDRHVIQPTRRAIVNHAPHR